MHMIGYEEPCLMLNLYTMDGLQKKCYDLYCKTIKNIPVKDNGLIK